MVDLFRADTPNFRTEAAKKIAELFPETVIDGKIDLESIEELLNTEFLNNKEYKEYIEKDIEFEKISLLKFFRC